MKALLHFFSITTLLFTCITASAQWIQLGADIDGEAANDRSGWSVSISSDGLTVIIGAPVNSDSGNSAGQVRVYRSISGIWTQLGADIDGVAIGDISGQSVSMSSDGLTVAIGGPFNDGNGSNSGHVRVFQLIAGTWLQVGADIQGIFGDQSGWSVSMTSDGLTVAIGSPWNDGNGNNAGRVRVYKLIAGIWTQLGANIDGEGPDNISGVSVSISSDGLTVAIGASGNSGSFSGSGHVRVYQLIAGVWTKLGADIDGEAIGDESGGSVSMSSDGLTVAIGAVSNGGNGNISGHVRVYQLIAGVWTQLGADIDGEVGGDFSGKSVSMSSDGLTLAIGAPWNDGNGSLAGHVRVYQLITGVWTQLGIDIDGEAIDDRSGQSVNISSDGLTVAIGAFWNDGNGSNSGHVRVYSFCASATSSTFSVNTCSSYIVPSGNEIYTTSQTVMDTIPNIAGCDSVMTINISINNTIGTDTQVTCGSYTWIDGNTYTTSNSTATFNIVGGNSNGCDSLVTLDLTVNTVDVSLTTTIPSITSNAIGGNYQWLDCNNNFAIIPGDTNQIFTATNNGDYAVQVIQNGCIDTSACVSISTIGILENDFGTALNLYPNPTEGKLSINFGQLYNDLTIQVRNVTGQLVSSFNFGTTNRVVFKIEGINGFYFIEISTKERKTARLGIILKK